MEAASPPGAASENSSNDVQEVKGGGWGCGCGGRPNPKLEGSVTKTIAWSRPLIFLPFQPGMRREHPPRASAASECGSPSCGGRGRRGPGAGGPRTRAPRPQPHRGDTGVQRSAWRCFGEGSGFAVHHGNPRAAPSNSNRAPRAPARTFAAFAARPEACKALSLGRRAVPKPPKLLP